MDTRQLQAFCEVVERKSFSLAAERLGVTQPAVSLQVRARILDADVVAGCGGHLGTELKLLGADRLEADDNIR